MAVAYVKHPVTPKRKEQLINDGFKLVDIRFKPESVNSDDLVDDGKPKSIKKKTLKRDK